MKRNTLLASLGMDLLLGEPPVLHPVRGMGALLRFLSEPFRGKAGSATKVQGALAVVSGVVFCGISARLIELELKDRGAIASTLLTALCLKPTFSLRALLEAGEGVCLELEAGRLDVARALLGRDLVSRPTGDLTSPEVAGAAIESVSENFTDSVVAPLLWASVAGLPGAYAYRFLNTADAMVGYRTPDWEAFGTFAARSDDLANLLPARIAGALLAIVAPFSAGCSPQAFSVMLRDSGETASPNAGWTMAAMAGALGVRLSKRGHYTLFPEGREPTAKDLRTAIRIVRYATMGAVLLSYFSLGGED